MHRTKGCNSIQLVFLSDDLAVVPLMQKAQNRLKKARGYNSRQGRAKPKSSQIAKNTCLMSGAAIYQCSTSASALHPHDGTILRVQVS